MAPIYVVAMQKTVGINYRVVQLLVLCVCWTYKIYGNCFIICFCIPLLDTKVCLSSKDIYSDFFYRYFKLYYCGIDRRQNNLISNWQ